MPHYGSLAPRLSVAPSDPCPCYCVTPPPLPAHPVEAAMSCIAVVSGPGVPCRCCGPLPNFWSRNQASAPSSSCVLIVRKPSRYLSVSAHAESDCTEDQMPKAEGFASRPHQRRGRLHLCLKVCKQSPASLARREERLDERDEGTSISAVPKGSVYFLGLSALEKWHNTGTRCTSALLDTHRRHREIDY